MNPDQRNKKVVWQVKPGPRPGFRWDRDTIVYAIDLWHRRTLRTPAKAEWRQAGPDHPSTQTVLRVFGGWNAAIAAAGYRPRRRGQQKQPSRWRRSDHASILHALTDWHERHERPPTKAEWEATNAHVPSCRTIARAFGAWSTALQAAGLEPRRPPTVASPPRCSRTGRWLPRSLATVDG